MLRKLTLTRLFLLAVLLVIAISPMAAQDDPVEFMRFFGLCEEYEDITGVDDTSNFAGECPIIQIMTNTYNEGNPDNPVETTVVDWPGFTELNTRLAAGDPPDIMTLHGIRIPNYASRGLLTPLSSLFEQYGIDTSDFTDAALEYVSYNGEIYGVPLDLHGHLYYINLDLWEQADLLDADGAPIIPDNFADWQATAQQFNDATGLPLWNWEVGGASMSRDWMALVHQQGGAIQDDEGNPAIDTPEGLAALELILQIMADPTFTTPNLPDSSKGETFSNGEVGSIRDGTWRVNFYDAQTEDPSVALERFYVTSFPQFFDQGATWSSTHAYIIPLGVNADPERLDKTMKFLAWMNENNGVWAYTGHFPVNTSFIESDAYTSIPHRLEYANFDAEAVPMPRLNWVTAYEDVVGEEIEAAIIGDKSPEQALADAQSRLEDFAAFGQ